MSTCVYLIIFLANDLLPLYLTEKSVKQLPQLYSKLVSVFYLFQSCFSAPMIPQSISYSLHWVSLVVIRASSFDNAVYCHLPRITLYRTQRHTDLFEIQESKSTLYWLQIRPVYVAQVPFKCMFQYESLQRSAQEIFQDSDTIILQCSTHSDSLFTLVFKGSAVNPNLDTS